MKPLLVLTLCLSLIALSMGQSLSGGTKLSGGIKISTSCTTPPALVDDFNRPNGGPPPSASWTDTIVVGDGGIKVDTNAAVGNTVGFNSAYLNTGTYGPDVAVAITFTTTIGSYGRVYFRVVSEGTAGVDGYFLQFDNTSDTFEVYRIDNGVATQLGANISATLGDGDEFMADVRGPVINICHKPSGGSWTFVDSRTDATYSAAGRIGFGMQSSLTMDDFRGGTR